MNRDILAEKKYNYLLISFAICVVFINIKSAFMDYNYDAGYAVAMAYRMVQGDGMLDEMWEPHQTSAFLCAALIKLYLMLTGTTTGIVLYLQLAGVMLKGLVAVFIYNMMKSLVRRKTLYLMCLFFLGTSPKGLTIPEFSNMQLWFSIGIFCCMMRYIQVQEQKRWLVAAAVFLCLEVLAYPSCLIIFGGVVYILCRYARKKRQAILLVSGVCAGCGFAYLGYFVWKLGWQSLWENAGSIVSGDEAHAVSIVDKWQAYVRECGEISLGMLMLAIATYLVLKLLAVILYFCGIKSIGLQVKRYWLLCFFVVFLVCDVIQAIQIELTYEERLPIYIPILIVAGLGLNKCETTERQIVVSGMLLSLLNFLATLVLTNLTVLATLNYLILAVMVAFIPVMRWVEAIEPMDRRRRAYFVIWLFCVVTFFRSGYIIKCMSTEKTNILNIAGVVKDGPAKGLVSEYMGPHLLNVTLEEWDRYIEAGDKVLIVGAGLYDPLLYLYEDVEICTASTICTPTYNELLLEYWEKHPEKYPNVVVLDCWFGEARVEEHSWIMQWLNTDFKPEGYRDGSYWRYYRR